MLKASYAREDGRTFAIRKVAIDGAFNSQEVYRFSLLYPQQVMVVRGRSGFAGVLSVPTAMEVGESGKKKAFGGRLWSVGVDVVKMEIYGWLRNDDHQPGYARWPHEYPDEYFKQLTAERMVLQYRRGYEEWKWEKYRARNEALDCRVYARAAAAAIGIDGYSVSKWAILVSDGVVSTQPTRIGCISK